MKQTAVEWFFKQLTEIDYGCINKTFLQNNNSLAGHKLRELLEQAKAIDEKNLKDSFVAGAGVGEMFNNENRIYVSDAEKYYKETFEKN